MDIRVIRTELSNYLDYSDEYLREQVKNLVLKLNDAIQLENTSPNSDRYLTIIREYRLKYEDLKNEFTAIPKENILERIHKVQEVLVCIDSLLNYTSWVLSRIPKTFGSSQQLEQEREAYRTSSFNWGHIASALNLEYKFRYLQGSEDE